MDKKIKIYNSHNMAAHLREQNHAAEIAIFRGDMKTNLHAAAPDIYEGTRNIVPITSDIWANSEGYIKLWNEIGELQHRLKTATAAAQPDDKIISELIQRLFIDVTRRAAESGDLTSLIAEEQTNFDFPEVVHLREFYEYVGEFQEISGTNDPVPLIEQTYGEADVMTMHIYANGWKDSLRNRLFNPLHSMQKVNSIVTKSDADLRNSLVLGQILRHNFTNKQKVAADNTGGATRDEKMYNTMIKGVRTIRTLKDRQTNKAIPARNLTLLVNSVNTWDIERVIRGQLDINGAAGTRGYNRQALPIESIIEYDGGNTDGRIYGKKQLAFPGVEPGKAYLFVPKFGAFVGNKRPLTQETGYGSTLELSTQESAWYRVMGTFMKDFLGHADGYGAVIEITLPQ